MVKLIRMIFSGKCKVNVTKEKGVRMIVGRNAELNFLNQHYNRENSCILVVYGQKGVGKTTLLKNFAQNKPSSYYLARCSSAREQCYQWSAELVANGATLSKYPSYSELFLQCMVSNKDGKRVLIIDEFHHMVKADARFMQELTAFVKSVSVSQPVMVLLCTSSSGWVENSMIRKMGSLALAINGLLKVREMKFGDMTRIFPEYTLEQCIEIYATLGGIPGLWNSFNSKLSVKDNMIHYLLNRESRLHEEMNVYMAEELREPAVYNTILASMANGCSKLNDIYKHTGFARAKISVYLKILMELDLVEKVFSYDTAGRANSQKGIYRITNPYVRFYFRYIFPNQSMIQEMRSEELYDVLVKDTYPDFVEDTYRKICSEYISKQYSDVGEWIGKTGNIDIVANDASGNMVVAACSYAKKMTYEDLEWLKFVMKKAKVAQSKIILFSEKGFDDKLEKVAREEDIKLLSILQIKE